MKKILFMTGLLCVVLACNNETQEQETTAIPDKDSVDFTNDFYDNEETHLLANNGEIAVAGEISNPGMVSFSELPLRSVVVKETLLGEEGNSFVGAYRYDGYSLYDILNTCHLQKKNQEEFPPIIDLYVEVENADGEKVLISWGELFYPIHRHEIIVATRVMHIVPSKTKDMWPLPEESRLIIASDLLTERNISNPVKITVKTLDADYPIDRDIKMWADEMIVITPDSEDTYNDLPNSLQEETIHNIFYGRGRGIHGVTPFKGAYLMDLIADKMEINRENIMHGMFVIAAVDGYRSAHTFAEIMNRNDNAETLIIDQDNYEDAGRFSLLVTADFFSDRAIKSITEIRFVKL